MLLADGAGVSAHGCSQYGPWTPTLGAAEHRCSRTSPMSTATTVVASVAIVIGTLAILAFVLNSATATAGSRLPSFVGFPGRASTPESHQDAVLYPVSALAESDAIPSETASTGSPSTSTSDFYVLYSVTRDLITLPRIDRATTSTGSRSVLFSSGHDEQLRARPLLHGPSDSPTGPRRSGR
jgi:hypothetical protein